MATKHKTIWEHENITLGSYMHILCYLWEIHIYKDYLTTLLPKVIMIRIFVIFFEALFPTNVTTLFNWLCAVGEADNKQDYVWNFTMFILSPLQWQSQAKKTQCITTIRMKQLMAGE